MMMMMKMPKMLPTCNSVPPAPAAAAVAAAADDDDDANVSLSFGRRRMARLPRRRVSDADISGLEFGV